MKVPARFPLKRLALVGILAMLVSGSVYAYAASNTVPSTTVGSGSGTISGYTVSGVSYTLDATTPTNLDQVSFSISPATASSVKAQLSPGGNWYPCTNTSGSVTCATTSPQATAAAVAQLTVVAVQ